MLGIQSSQPNLAALTPNVRRDPVLFYGKREFLNGKRIDVVPGGSRTIVLPTGERLGDIQLPRTPGLSLAVSGGRGQGIAVKFMLSSDVPSGTVFPIEALTSHGFKTSFSIVAGQAA